MSYHHVTFLNNQEEIRAALAKIGVDDGAYAFLVPKGVYRHIILKSIPCRAANIIKQEMLSKGGDAAVSKQALYGEGHTDVLIMGTLKQYRLLIKKLKLQPLGLKQIAGEIEKLLENLNPVARRVDLCHGRSLQLGKRTLIMGILNVTPGSFSDGGRYTDLDQALKRALEMREQGADIIDIGGVSTATWRYQSRDSEGDIIDIGGVSTRPQAQLVGLQEELERVLPVVKRLAQEDMILSVDTFRGQVAAACLDAGAHIINNIGGLVLDEGLLPVLVERKAPVVLMHNRLQINAGKPYQDLIADIINELDIMIKETIAAGFPAEKIIIDPGLGFGKTPAENRRLIKQLASFKGLGKPILIGASRKRFIGHTLDVEIDQRLEGSLAVLAAAILNGADIVRVHDVKESYRVATMIDAIKNENG